MADDIDDLLNDIEKKINTKDALKWEDDDCQPRSRSTGANKSNQNLSTGSESQYKKSHDLDVSDILSDPLDDDLGDTTRKPRCNNPRNTVPVCSTDASLVSPRSGQAATSSGQRCVPVFIGGSRCDKGLSTAVNKRSCDRLRCTDCDFQVSSFGDFQWMPDTNYLFLRNNMPDYERVQSKLKSKKGCRAYACQCRWLNAVELTEVSKTDVKWVCGKH